MTDFVALFSSGSDRLKIGWSSQCGLYFIRTRSCLSHGNNTSSRRGRCHEAFDLLWSVCDRAGCAPAEAIELLEQAARLETHRAKDNEFKFAELVKRLWRVRMKRNDLVGTPLFRDPAWDMLLALYSAHCDGETLSISSLCYASGVPQTTALRQLARLEENGMVERCGDKNDLRRCLIRATRRSVEVVEGASAMLLDQLRSFYALNASQAFEQRAA